MKALILGISVLLVAAVTFHQAPSLAAGGLLYPARREPHATAPSNCRTQEFPGLGVTLRGWECRATNQRRGALVYLHGIADNRDSSVGVIHRFSATGLDVVAYDSRAHGVSDGEVCTYGYFEKEDLRRVIAALQPGPVVLMGTSLGGAVALQAAADDGRVSGVIAAEVFSDLHTIGSERAPWFIPKFILAKAFRAAEQRGRFQVSEVSPVRAATRIRVPVLLIHGEADLETPSNHSRRIYEALRGPKRLILVPLAGHNQSLRGAAVWAEVDSWVDDLLGDRKPS